MMSKQLKGLLLALAALLLLGGGLAAALLVQPAGEGGGEQALRLVDRPINDVQSIAVTNREGTYHILREGGGYLIEELGSLDITPDYLQMALEEASTIVSLAVAEERPADLTPYGLKDPEARVEIIYTDGQTASLAIGALEPVSDARYVMLAGDDRVHLMDRARTIRFTMPVTEYIQYQITPTRTLHSPLAVIKNITFSGEALPEPIVVQEVRADSPEEMRRAASFGAATHVIVSPGLHELDQAAGAEVFQSLLGLMSEGVEAYGCTPEQLTAYGFDTPWLQVDMELQNGENAPREQITLRVARGEGGTLFCTRDDSAVVHKIREVAFTKTSYEQLAMRWFLTPFITDLSELTVQTPEGQTVFVFSGEGDNKALGVTCEGKALDVAAFRKYYQLLVSASADGTRLAPQDTAPEGEPLLGITFRYRDPQKPEDVLRLYPGATRRVRVQVNGQTEFSMRETYVERATEATRQIVAGGEFSTEW